MGLKDLCQHVHELYAKYDIARLTTEMYLSDLKPAMKPSDAYAHIAQRKTERVEIDHLVGRTTVGLVTPYPPGIPLLIPGKSSTRRSWTTWCSPRIRQGMPGLRDRYPRSGGAGRRERQIRYYADCVAEPAPSRRPRRAAARPVPNRRPSLL
jgi:arginine decarboxylase